ncbi:MAG: hypothetical protein ACM4D3_16500 [Candidatus Sericytochromatia bacterium]
MRKTIAAVSSTTLALLFGGVGSSTATASTLAADESGNDASGDHCPLGPLGAFGAFGELTGPFGPLGLLGIRRDADRGVATTPAVGRGTMPRA